MERALSRFFGNPEEINGGERCPSYMFRWHIFRCRWFKAYLHKFVGEDWSKDLHDHPRRFISIGLWGEYFEENKTGVTTYRAPWFRTFAAEHSHRIWVTPGTTCWTLAIVFKITRDWGFWNDGKWLQWESYVRGKYSHIADSRRTCPSDELPEGK